MRETTVKIELGKTDLQLASTEVIKHLNLNPPTDEECTTASCQSDKETRQTIVIA